VAVVGDAQDVADFRRSRLAAKGKVAENVDFVMEYDFAFPGRPSFMDVYLDVDEVAPVGRVRVGQMRAPFGLEAMSSIREVAFLERSLFQAMLPFRQVGVNWYGTTADDRMTWSWAGYRFPTDVFADVAGDKGYGTSVRGTTLVYDDSDRARTVHVGASYSYNEPSTNFVRLRTAPEVGFNQLDFRSTEFPVPFFVDTGVLPTESYQLAGLELAGTRGPWWFQSEWLHTTADTLDFGNADFHGGYAQIAYCLTGETHAYNKQAGAYGRIIPHKNAGKCGIGAWELAGRWSYLDLTDNGVVGGEIEDLTAGINWYFNRFTKFQINYIHSTLDRPAGTESETNVFARRAQLDF
jgi:phosphate-selective porin OprO/OprP